MKKKIEEVFLWVKEDDLESVAEALQQGIRTDIRDESVAKLPRTTTDCV